MRCPACLTLNAVWAETQAAGDRPPAQALKLSEQCAQWNVQQVLVFVRALGCDDHTRVALEHYQVDGQQLLDLTKQDLLQMGITKEDQVKSLLSAIDLVQKSQVQ